MERETTGFLIRGNIPFDLLANALSEETKLPSDQVAILDYTIDQEHAILVQLTYRQSGFQTEVSLLTKKTEAGRVGKSQQIAEKMAKRLSDDVLVSPPSGAGETANPYVWQLISPSGSKQLVNETEPDSGVIQIAGA